MSTHPRSVAADDLLRRIRGEYTEMPGLRVTDQQAQRLWALDAATCREALDNLIGDGFLRRTEAGHYVRVDGTAVTPLRRMAKMTPADLPASRRAAV